MFHIGYYLIVVHKLAPALDFMPDLSTVPDVDLALQLFAASCLALEAGSLFSLAFSPRRSMRSLVEQVREDKAFFRLGVAVTTLSGALFGLYVYQLGGPSALASLDYSSYVGFLQSTDPRFAALNITYLPVGLLLLYAFLDRSSPHHRRTAVSILFAFFLFTALLLWIGNRGAALLDWTALAYIHHISVRKITLRKLVLVFAAILFVIGPIRELRGLSAGARTEAVQHISYSPLRGVSEMGQTLSPYLAFIQQRQNGTSLGFAPYVSAIAHISPNFGVSPRQAAKGPSDYYRSTVWISSIIDPAGAEQGFSVGGSAIGEPYAAFGVPGVVVIFVLIGWVIARLEAHAALGSGTALALIALAFPTINWYVRDDAYGSIRPVAWALLAVIGIKLILAQRAVGEARGAPEPAARGGGPAVAQESR